MQKRTADLRSKLEFLLAFSTDAVFILDDQGTIQEVNEEACKIFECDRDVLLNTSLRTWRTNTPIRPHPDLDRPDILCYSAFFRRHTGVIFLGDMSISTAVEGEQRAYVAILRDMTWHLEAAAKDNLAAAVFDNSIQAIIVTDAENHITAVNPAFERLTGYTADEVIGKSPNLLRSERHDESFYQTIWDTLLKYGSWQGEVWDRRKNGEVFPGWLTISVVRNEVGVITHYVAIIHDITDRKQSEARLQHVTDFYSALCQIDQLVATRTDPQDLFNGICQISVDYGHAQCACITALDPSTDTLSVSARFCKLHDNSCFPGVDLALSLSRSAIRSGNTYVEQEASQVPLFPGPGDPTTQTLSSAAFPFKHGDRMSGALVVFSGDPAFFDNDLLHLLRRIADGISFALDGFDQEALRQAAESRAHYLARHDILTGLQRRNVIEEAMAQQHAKSAAENSAYALSLIDLDRFKMINDSYGHAVGDDVLIHVANILRATMRTGDWVGRWGGEEFLCVLPGATPESALRSMERLRQKLSNTPVIVGTHPLKITASVGVACFPADGATISDLMARVDTALYQAKQEGGNRVRQAGSAASIFLMGGQIEEALGQARILAAHQDIISLKDGTIVADESLARMRLPNGQLLDAAKFLEAATHLGQLHRIDQVVIGLTFGRFLNRIRARRSPILHFVNASTALLAQTQALTILLNEINPHKTNESLRGDEASPFVIELTERSILRDHKAAKRHLLPLLEKGLRIALDDFGSGYSSLLYLADFPVSFLKIEQQLVARVTTEKRVAVIVADIARLGQDLGITTIAEGIENADIAETIQELGIDWGQGFYFGRPVLS